MLINQYTAVRAYPHYLLLYSVPPPKKSILRYDISQEKRQVKGELSLTSKRKLKRAISNLAWIAEDKIVSHSDHKGTRQVHFKLNFITLTLPARQRDSDYEVKQHLNTFLTGMRYYGLSNYVWRAEKQANGNIHIHLATDIYIHWQDIRRKWNKILSKSGYLIAYAREQREWHKQGFKLRPDLIKFGWSRSQQFKAYNEGVASNWTNPNTTDVHKVHKVKNLAAYVSKYMLKDEQNGSEGRLWGCSRNLLEKPQDLQITNEQMQELAPTAFEIDNENCIFVNSDLLIAESDFYSVYRLPDWWQVHDSLKELKQRMTNPPPPSLLN